MCCCEYGIERDDGRKNGKQDEGASHEEAEALTAMMEQPHVKSRIRDEFRAEVDTVVGGKLTPLK